MGVATHPAFLILALWNILLHKQATRTVSVWSIIFRSFLIGLWYYEWFIWSTWESDSELRSLASQQIRCIKHEGNEVGIFFSVWGNWLGPPSILQRCCLMSARLNESRSLHFFGLYSLCGSECGFFNGHQTSWSLTSQIGIVIARPARDCLAW